MVQHASDTSESVSLTDRYSGDKLTVVSSMDRSRACPKACLTIQSSSSSGVTSMIVESRQRKLRGKTTTSRSQARLSLLLWLREKPSQSEPGSSTSKPSTHHRHVGLLSIQGSQFQIAEIPLKTVRPFIFDEITLSHLAENEENKINLEDRDSITAFLRRMVRILLGDVEC